MTCKRRNNMKKEELERRYDIVKHIEEQTLVMGCILNILQDMQKKLNIIEKSHRAERGWEE